MSDDLKNRLINPESAMRPTISDGRRAFARIEALEAKLAKAVALLEEFADVADEADEYGFDDFNQAPINCGQCRAVRAALAELEAEKDTP